MYCQVEVPATGRSLVQRSPTERGVSECDLENLKNEELIEHDWSASAIEKQMSQNYSRNEKYFRQRRREIRNA